MALNATFKITNMPKAEKIIVGATPRGCPGANGRDDGQSRGIAPTGDAF